MCFEKQKETNMQKKGENFIKFDMPKIGPCVAIRVESIRLVFLPIESYGDCGECGQYSSAHRFTTMVQRTCEYPESFRWSVSSPPVFSVVVPAVLLRKDQKSLDSGSRRTELTVGIRD